MIWTPYMCRLQCICNWGNRQIHTFIIFARLFISVNEECNMQITTINAIALISNRKRDKNRAQAPYIFVNIRFHFALLLFRIHTLLHTLHRTELNPMMMMMMMCYCLLASLMNVDDCCCCLTGQCFVITTMWIGCVMHKVVSSNDVRRLFVSEIRLSESFVFDHKIFVGT